MCIGFLVSAVVLSLSRIAFANSLTITIPMADVAAGSGERGSYYVVAVDPPEELVGKRLDSVFLEFVVDVDAVDLDDDSSAYAVGVFPLQERFTGEDPEYATDVPSVRVVSAGEDKLVMVDITETVRGWMEDPASNHGLVIGALTGPRVGRLTISEGVLGPGAAVRITFFYQNRSGGRVPAP